MVPVGFFFLLFLTGGGTSSLKGTVPPNQGGNISSSELLDEQESKRSFEETPDFSSLEHRDDEELNPSFEETSGGHSSGSEPPENYGQPEPKSEEKVHQKERCTSADVINHLNLTTNSAKYTVSRPFYRHSWPSGINLGVIIHAILDVKENDQQLISHISLHMGWWNYLISWNPSDFCGLEQMQIPTKLLWMPDITIEEVADKEKSEPSPYIRIYHYGWIKYINDQVLTSACRMNAYKFPFDILSCNISFKSVIYSDEEVYLYARTDNNTAITERSRNVMHTQYEWLFINLTVNEQSVNYFGFNQTVIVYTITMKRRSVLYMANLILPVLFFLCLDLGSFLISDTGGEKIGFKVTVLLAITVMQLILHDILPASSNRIPLIAIYCIGVFSLMLLSLVETILVMYLLEKDSASKDETDGDKRWNGDKQDNYFREMKTCRQCVSVDDVSTDEKLSVDKQGSSSKLIEVSFALEKVSDELVETEKAITKLSSRKEEVKPGYWTRVVKKINTVFITFYITAATVFLALIFSVWFSPEVNTD